MVDVVSRMIANHWSPMDILPQPLHSLHVFPPVWCVPACLAVYLWLPALSACKAACLPFCPACTTCYAVCAVTLSCLLNTLCFIVLSCISSYYCEQQGKPLLLA